MNAKELQKIIQMAKDAVKDEEEPYKTEGYKIILAKLMDSATAIGFEPIPDIQSLEQSEKTYSFETLATKCNLSVKEIKDIFEIKNAGIEIIAPIKGSDAQKHIKITLCILAASEIILGKEWTLTSVIVEALRSAGVKDLANFSSTLKKHPEKIRMKGVKKFKEYKLTSTEGKSAAFELIRKIAQGDDE